MKLEDQCVSLELAKKMEELGFPQKSLFYWYENIVYFGETKLFVKVSSGHSRSIHVCNLKSYGAISAYSVAELGEMLPPHTDSGKDGQGYACYTVISEDGGQTHWDTVLEEDENFVPQRIWASSESDARAKMLIWLKENGKI